MKLKQDIVKYCPNSCDSLYKGRCIMRKSYGDNPHGLFLFADDVGLGKRYIRRDDCPLIDASGNRKVGE